MPNLEVRNGFYQKEQQMFICDLYHGQSRVAAVGKRIGNQGFQIFPDMSHPLFEQLQSSVKKAILEAERSFYQRKTAL